MSDTKRFDKEILSAWVDGNVSENDREQSLQQGSESMAVWARYHMIGQVMREEVQHMDLDISAKVSQAVAQESAHSLGVDEQALDEQAGATESSNVIPFPSRIWKQAGGFAVAASVAIVALFSVSNTQPNVSNNQAVSSFATTEAGDTSSTTVSVLSPEVSVASNVERQELQTMHDMFLKHEALARQTTGMSSLPSVRVVSNQKIIPVQVPVPLRTQNETESSAETKAQAKTQEKAKQD